MAPRIWVDVEDLFIYAAGSKRPSGIQRLVFELTTALRTLHGQDNVRFLRHGGVDAGFTEVSWTEVETLFGKLPALRVRAEAGRALRLGYAPPCATLGDTFWTQCRNDFVRQSHVSPGFSFRPPWRLPLWRAKG